MQKQLTASHSKGRFCLHHVMTCEDDILQRTMETMSDFVYF